MTDASTRGQHVLDGERSTSSAAAGTNVLPSRSRRIVVAIVIGVVCGLVSWLKAKSLTPPAYQDFAYLWFGGKALIGGRNPYQEVVSLSGGPILFYPLPTVLVLLPLVALPLVLAGPLFIALTCGVLAYAITASAWWPLLMFASGSMVLAVTQACLATLPPIGLFVPWLGWLGVFKPNIGLSILAYRPSWKNAAMMCGIVVASLLVRPAWPRDWLGVVVDSSFHFAPWRAPGGFILVLSVLRWRRPEGRLLAMMSLLPSSPIAYEALPLFIIPRSRVELLVLAIGSGLAFILVAPFSLQSEQAAYLARAQPAMIWLVYVPTLVMVLRRPNVGPVPKHLDRLAMRAPAWLGGGEA